MFKKEKRQNSIEHLLNHILKNGNMQSSNGRNNKLFLLFIINNTLYHKYTVNSNLCL